MFWSPCSPRDSQESSLAPRFESNNSLALSLLYGPKHPYMTPLTVWIFVGKVTSLLFNLLSRFVIAFKEKMFIHFMAAVTKCSDFGAPEIKSLSLSIFFPHLFPIKCWDQML